MKGEHFKTKKSGVYIALHNMSSKSILKGSTKDIDFSVEHTFFLWSLAKLYTLTLEEILNSKK